jgi:transcriptional regulator GlxA family with amidase domain
MSADYVIAIPIYQGVDLMDVAAPYEIFKWMANYWTVKNVQVHLVAESQSSVKTRDDLELSPHMTFDMVKQVDLLWIPGGDPDALVAQMGNVKYVTFIQMHSQTAQYVTTVCEGALIAADAGLLDGYEVTTHWAFIECLRNFYPSVQICQGYPRYVQDRNRVSGGGISSGLDEALYLVKLIAGQAVAEEVQVTMQYFPRPPVAGQIPDSSRCVLRGKFPSELK